MWFCIGKMDFAYYNATRSGYSMTPEEKARQQIDAQLAASGWVVQTKDNINLAASRGVANCELSFATGERDYSLFVDGRALGTVEAKPEGEPLTGVEEQSTKYVSAVPATLPAWKNPLPFCYEGTGTETCFTSQLDPEPRSRSVFAFHCPESLLDWVQRDKQRAQRLRESPMLSSAGLWPAQIVAIDNLEQSFAVGQFRSDVPQLQFSQRKPQALIPENIEVGQPLSKQP